MAILKPRISIVTITYNSREFVKDAIESVLGQTYDNMEYIVVDGGSTDGTVEVIKAYESRIAEWVSEKDEGIADAFNKGLSRATGEYVLFLNSDDMLADENVLENIAEKIVENQSPTMIYGDFDCLNRNSGEIVYQGGIVFYPEKLIYGHIIPQPCLFTNRRYFEKYGNFDTGYKIAMDYEWFLRGVRKETVIHVPIRVTKIRGGGISALNPDKAAKEIISALRKNGFFSNRFAEYKVRGYFTMRALLRKVLMRLRLYGLLTKIRDRARSLLYHK
ncbi:MAG TPA: glycosyltransferase family 2 protein [Gallionellaceae bacterium]